MKTNLNELYEALANDHLVFLNFLKETIPVNYNANLFLRDIQFCIKTYFGKKDITLSYSDSEYLALRLTDFLIEKSMISAINKNAWKVNFNPEDLVREDESGLIKD